MIYSLLSTVILTIVILIMAYYQSRIASIAKQRFEKIGFLENVIDHKDDQIEELMKRNMRDSYILRDQERIILEMEKKSNKPFAMKDKEEAE